MIHVRAESDAVAAAERVEQLLRRQAARFDRLARRVHRRMSTPDVHDLRVLVRRIRGSAWIVRQIAPAPAVQVLRRTLRRVGRALGERRLTDVAIADATAYGLGAAPLEARREAAGAAVVAHLGTARRAAVLALMREAGDVLARRPRRRLADALARRASRLEKACRRAPEGKRRMHELRIEAKKARYVLEALGRPSEVVKPLQLRLGRAHDLEVLQELLGASRRAARDERRARALARRIMRRVVARAAEELRA
jgi:CHAD domain-containing protein